MKQCYVPVLTWTLRHRSLMLGGRLFGSQPCARSVCGREFIPFLDEGALTPKTVRLPSVSLPKSIEMEKQALSHVEFPEVRMAVSKIGRPELAECRRNSTTANRSCP